MHLVQKRSASLVGLAGIVIFSFWLMFHTFSYNPQSKSIMIASKLWSDFGAHLPLIRSFSMGGNFNRLIQGEPIESPLFPGEPIRYHFGFYALVGVLEKLGLRLDWALNILSAIGLAGLIGLIWWLAVSLFRDRRVATLSLLFFLFNGSLSFLSFFKTHPISLTTIRDIVTNSRFSSFGPWDGGEITAFWTLNVFTNQRHLALSYALILLPLLVMALSKKRRLGQSSFIVAASMSVLLFLNHAAAAIALLFLLWFFLVKKEVRLLLALAGLLTIPSLWLAAQSMNVSFPVVLYPGYLIKPPLTLVSLSRFWFLNLGLHTLLIPLGIVLAPKSARRLVTPPLLVLFVLPNVFRFSPDMINNHKFFNFFLILGNMFSAYAVVRLTLPHERKRVLGLLRLVMALFLTLGLTLSGFIDLFPIINDAKGSLPDLAANADIRFFATQVPKGAVVANSNWFYHPASLAGRAIFSGYTYFTWSYGYNQGKRENELAAIYRAETKEEACQLLRQNNIAFVELIPKPEEYLKPNWELWNSLDPAYENPSTHLRIYSIEALCD